MKKLLIVVALAGTTFSIVSCSDKKDNENAEQNNAYQQQNSELKDSLQVALANSDSLFAILYDVTTGMEQITTLEKLLDTKINTESPTARKAIVAQIEAIRAGLADRRQRIAELEKKLGTSASENSKLQKQIALLHQQIDSQTAMVEKLTAQLGAANIKIASMDSTITHLNTTVDTISAQKARIAEQKAQTQAELDQAVIDLNTVYYVIGTDKELKSHNILQGGGFLRKTKVLPADFDKSYMSKADKRTLSSIPLDAKKAQVMTKQPENSYTLIKDANDMLTLRITNPSAFWATTNILVIKVN